MPRAEEGERVSVDIPHQCVSNDFEFWSPLIDLLTTIPFAAMQKSILILMALMLAAGSANGQIEVIFEVDQPPQFIVDAGGDQVFSGTGLTLGGQPTAVGGGGSHSFSWEPADGLDDANSPNPILLDLAATTMFTVRVTDVTTGCVKSDGVEVVLDNTSGIQGSHEGSILIYPNPVGSDARVEAQENIAAITLRSIAGEEVLFAAYPASPSTVVDLRRMSDGLYVMTLVLASGRITTHKLCKASSDH